MERKYIMQLPRGAKVSSTDIKYEDGKIVLTAQLEEWKPEDGDICYLKTNNTHVFVFKSFRYNKTGASCYVSLSGNYLVYDAFMTNLGDIRPATDEEKKKLFDALAKQNMRWNPEKKIVENVRWRAKKGEPYYFLTSATTSRPRRPRESQAIRYWSYLKTQKQNNMENETKTCPKCGRTLTADNFYRRGDGSLYTYCKECVKANNRKYRNTPPDSENPLSAFTPRQLMQELVRRGYTGKLKLVTINEIDLNNL